VGFVVDKVSLGQVFSEYIGFPCKFSFEAGTIGQLAGDVPSGLNLTPLQETKKKTAQTVELFGRVISPS
jgi:hypothetical protein